MTDKLPADQHPLDGVAEFDLATANKDFGDVRKCIDGRLEPVDGIAALERIAIRFNKLRPYMAQLLPADRAEALDAARLNAVYTDVVTLPIPVYERMKAVLMQPVPAPVEKVEGLEEALREFDDLPEQDTTSLIILKAARLQLARQEGR